MVNRSSVAPADRKGDDWGDPALTKRFYGFYTRLVLGPLVLYQRPYIIETMHSYTLPM